MRPMLPSWMRSASGRRPWLNRRAIETTKRRFALTNSFLAALRRTALVPTIFTYSAKALVEVENGTVPSNGSPFTARPTRWISANAASRKIRSMSSVRSFAARAPAVFSNRPRAVIDDLPRARPVREDRGRSGRKAPHAGHRSDLPRGGIGRDPAGWSRGEGTAVRGDGSVFHLDQGLCRVREDRGDQGGPPQGGQERVRQGEPALGGFDRTPVQPRAPAAGRPHPGGQH